MTAALTLAQALLAAQQAMPAVQRSAINPHFRSKFVPLDGLLESVLPVLNEHGLVLSQWPTAAVETGQPIVPALRTRITHAESGEFVEDVMLLMVAKDDPQGQGSAITYARRYALTAMLALVSDEDDDGQKASGQSRRQAGEPSAASASRGGSTETTASTSAASPALKAPTGPRGSKAKPTADELAALTGLVDALIAGGFLTVEQLCQAAKSETPWPALADELSQPVVLDLTGRLSRRFGAELEAAQTA